MDLLLSCLYESFPFIEIPLHYLATCSFDVLACLQSSHRMRRGLQHSGGITTRLLLHTESENVFLRTFRDIFCCLYSQSAKSFTPILSIVLFSLDQEEQWRCTSCQLSHRLTISSLSDKLFWPFLQYTHFLLLHAPMVVVLIVQPPPSLLLFYFPTPMHALASLALCIMFIPYLSDTVCLGFCSAQPAGYYFVLT